MLPGRTLFKRMWFDLLTSYPTADENEMLNVAIFERDGSIENCPNYDDFLKFTEKAPIAAELVSL